jgi:predicted Zn-dependent peptidase
MRRDDPDRFAFALVDHVLGGGMSSRLFHEIREKRGLVYTIYSYRAAYEDAGFFGIYAGTSPQRLGEVLDLVHDELERLRRDGVSDDELRRAKSSVRGATALGLEDPAARMSRIGRAQLLYGMVPEVEWVLEQTYNVEQAALRRVIDQMLTGPATLAVVGPVEADALAGHALLG